MSIQWAFIAHCNEHLLKMCWIHHKLPAMGLGSFIESGQSWSASPLASSTASDYQRSLCWHFAFTHISTKIHCCIRKRLACIASWHPPKLRPLPHSQESSWRSSTSTAGSLQSPAPSKPYQGLPPGWPDRTPASKLPGALTWHCILPLLQPHTMLLSTEQARIIGSSAISICIHNGSCRVA